MVSRHPPALSFHEQRRVWGVVDPNTWFIWVGRCFRPAKSVSYDDAFDGVSAVYVYSF